MQAIHDTLPRYIADSDVRQRTLNVWGRSEAVPIPNSDSADSE